MAKQSTRDLLNTLADIQTRMCRIMQDAQKANRMIRDAEDALYEMGASCRVTPHRPGSQITTDKLISDCSTQS